MKPVSKQEAREVLEFLRAIPDDKWRTGDETFNDWLSPAPRYTGTHCFLGHVSLNPLSQWVIDQNKHLVVGQYFGDAAPNTRYRRTNLDCDLISANLNQLAQKKVGWSCVEANDNAGDYRFCEDKKSTPRERVCQTLELLIPHLPDESI